MTIFLFFLFLSYFFIPLTILYIKDYKDYKDYKEGKVFQLYKNNSLYDETHSIHNIHKMYMKDELERRFQSKLNGIRNDLIVRMYSNDIQLKKGVLYKIEKTITCEEMIVILSTMFSDVVFEYINPPLYGLRWRRYCWYVAYLI